MGDLGKAIQEDEEEYLRLCKQFHQEPKYKHTNHGSFLDIYGSHAQQLKRVAEKLKGS